MPRVSQAKAVGAALAATLFALTLPWAHAQEPADGEIAALADELRQLREEVKESNRADWALFAVSFAIGMAIAVAAVAGTVWNAKQLRRHVSLVEKDMATRLRPVLEWTADEDMPSRTFAIVKGNQIKIRIINAGQAAAIKIVLDARTGLTKDFEAGRESRYKGVQWGSLAPEKSIGIDLEITEGEMSSIRNGAERLRVEILLKYQDPGGNAYEYALSGEYDGKDMILRD